MVIFVTSMVIITDSYYFINGIAGKMPVKNMKYLLNKSVPNTVALKILDSAYG
jgi:hypothetical protein